MYFSRKKCWKNLKKELEQHYNCSFGLEVLIADLKIPHIKKYGNYNIIISNAISVNLKHFFKDFG